MQSATAAKIVNRLKPVIMHGKESNKMIDSSLHFLSFQLYVLMEELQLLLARKTQQLLNFFKTLLELGAASQHQPQPKPLVFISYFISSQKIKPVVPIPARVTWRITSYQKYRLPSLQNASESKR